MNGWAQARGPAGARLHLLARGRGGRRRPDRQEHRRRAHRRRSAASSGSARATPCSSSPASPEKFVQVRRRGAHQGRRASSNLVDKDRFEFCWIVDFPMYEWNEEEKKIDFSHNPFSMPQGGLDALEHARTRSTSSPSSTTSSATASSCPPARSATTARMSCARPSRSPAIREEVLEEKFGGMLPRASVRRAAARRHRARHRPHRDAAVRRDQSARSHRFSR